MLQRLYLGGAVGRVVAVDAIHQSAVDLWPQAGWQGRPQKGGTQAEGRQAQNLLHQLLNTWP